MDTPEKVRENRVRRVLARRGLRLAKSRRRDPGAPDFGLFQVSDADGREVPGFPAVYGLTLSEVEHLIAERDAANRV